MNIPVKILSIQDGPPKHETMIGFVSNDFGVKAITYDDEGVITLTDYTLIRIKEKIVEKSS